MRFRCSLILTALVTTVNAVSAAETALSPTLTLEKAMASVEGASLNVLLSREAALQAQEQANLIRVGVMPNISVLLQERRNQTVTVSSNGAVASVPFNRFDGKFVGNYNLVNPQVSSALRSARAGVDVAKADYKATVQLVLANVAQLYFTHLRDLRRLDVLNANIVRARSLYDLAVNQLKAGVATQIDVTRAETQLELANQARLQQDTVLIASELQLKRLLDLPPGDPMKLAEFSVRRADTSSFMFSDDKTTFEQRADWLRAQKAVEQARIDVKTATFERMPVLSLGGELGYAANYPNSSQKEAWFGGAALTVPIFDGLKSGTDRRAALSRQRSQEARLHNMELQISSELRLARQDAGSRNAQITVAEKNLKLGEEQLRLAQQRYQQGVADNREVVEAQNQLAIVEDNFVDAVYQYNLSRVELARARGDVRTVLLEKVE